MKINRETLAWRYFTRLATFLLIDISWLFFRVTDFRHVIYIFKQIIDDFHISYLMSNEFLGMFISTKGFLIVITSIIVVLKIDAMKYKNIDVKEKIYEQQICVRYLIYFTIIMSIIYWGAYGLGYEQTQFIYFQF